MKVDLKAVLDQLLDTRIGGKTVCPSEVARAVATLRGQREDWRAEMPSVHALVESEAAAGRVIISQRGEDVGSKLPRGAYRIRRATLKT